MYCDNHTNFAHVDYLNPREYHLLFSRIHILYDLARIAPFPRLCDMQPPYAYCFQKHKDANKDRPIVSYATHPLKIAYNMAARSLAFIMKHSDLRSHTLHRVHDMAPHLHAWWGDLHDTFGPHTRFVLYLADVKEMFTNLPHLEILKAIDFIIAACRNPRRGPRGSLRIALDPHGSVEFGKAIAPHS